MRMRRVVVVLLVAFCAAVISVPPSAQSGAGAGSSSGQQPTNTPPPQQSDQGGVSMMHPHVSNLQPGQTYHRPSEKEKLKAFAFDTVGPYPICRRGSNGRSSASRMAHLQSGVVAPERMASASPATLELTWLRRRPVTVCLKFFAKTRFTTAASARDSVTAWSMP